MLPMQLYDKKKFMIHYNDVPEIILRAISPYINVSNSSVLDFGCDLGLKTLGFAMNAKPVTITGVDINDNYKNLSKVAMHCLGLKEFPNNLKFHQIKPGTSLSGAGCFDVVLSWSVFEHVKKDILEKVVSDLYNSLSSGGIGFIQVNPLFHSPFGSHLSHVIHQPWVHLLVSENELKKLLFSFNELTMIEKERLWKCYASLNRIRFSEIVNIIKGVGFAVLKVTKGLTRMKPPLSLAQDHDIEDLMTEGFQMVISKPSLHE